MTTTSTDKRVIRPTKKRNEDLLILPITSPIPACAQAQMHYNESRRFIENRRDVGDAELFSVFNNIERFTGNAQMFNDKRHTKINTFFLS